MKLTKKTSCTGVLCIRVVQLGYAPDEDDVGNAGSAVGAVLDAERRHLDSLHHLGHRVVNPKYHVDQLMPVRFDI